MASPQMIKLFVGIETDLPALERSVNTWVRESGAEIVHIFGNMAPQTPAAEAAAPGRTDRRFLPSDILIVVVYRAKGA